MNKPISKVAEDAEPNSSAATRLRTENQLNAAKGGQQGGGW
jgi:hypothetical protein